MNDRSFLTEKDVLEWLRSRTDKEFLDVWSRAAQGRALRPFSPGDYDSHLVLAHVTRDPELPGGWEIEFLGVPADAGQWPADALIAQQGEHCSSTVGSYAKFFACPLCGGDAEGT